MWVVRSTTQILTLMKAVTCSTNTRLCVGDSTFFGTAPAKLLRKGLCPLACNPFVGRRNDQVGLSPKSVPYGIYQEVFFTNHLSKI